MSESDVKVTMNMGEPYATVHGERAVNDRHAAVHFYQNGLPFDSEGVLISNHSDIRNDEKKQKMVAKLQARAQKALDKERERAERVAAGETDIEDDDDEEQKDPLLPTVVDLAAWGRGSAKYQWQDVTNAIGARTGKRVRDKKEAINLLVTEGVLPRDQVSEQLRPQLD